MASRCRYNKSSDIGAHCLLTNEYALVPECDSIFLQYFTKNLDPDFPVIQTSIANTTIVGRLCVGNKNGLLVPSTITEKELEELSKNLPENVVFKVTEEPFSALGNVISCNDKIAFVNKSLDQNTIDDIADTLMVEIIPISFGEHGLVGSYSYITNKGGVISRDVEQEVVEELLEKTGFPIIPTTVNRNSNLIGAGICANDEVLICGSQSTPIEMATISKALISENITIEL